MDSLRSKSPTHEFSVYGLGGLSGLDYKLSGDGTKSGGAGGGIGLGYIFNINDNWGIVTGAEVGIFGSKVAYDSHSGEYEYGTAGTYDHFKLRYSMSGYEEQQKVTLFSVPVMVQFKTPTGRAHFYLAGGIKFGFPINAEATITQGRVTTSGDFSYEQIEYVDLEEYGFVNNMPLAETKSKIDLGFSATLALETGVRFSLSDNVALYTGAFLDYGLNDIRSVKDKHVIDYQISAPSEFVHNSVLNSALTDKVNIFAAGLKIRLSFGK
jgi:hypothetical protein